MAPRVSHPNLFPFSHPIPQVSNRNPMKSSQLTLHLHLDYFLHYLFPSRSNCLTLYPDLTSRPLTPCSGAINGRIMKDFRWGNHKEQAEYFERKKPLSSTTWYADISSGQGMLAVCGCGQNCGFSLLSKFYYSPLTSTREPAFPSIICRTKPSNM